MISKRTGFFKEFGEPKPPIEKEILSKQIYEVLKDISLQDLVLLLTNQFEEIIQYAELSKGKRSCQKMSLLFNPHRLKISSYNKKRGVYYDLKTETFARNLARAILYRRYTENTPINDLLFRIFQWSTGGMFYAHEFPPHVARDLAIKYGCNSQSCVLDPCAGWGGKDDWNFNCN